MTLTQAEKNTRALATDHLMADLGRRTASGGALAIGAQVVKMALHLVTLAVMARLLAPEDFGLVAMAATVTIFVGLFTDLGLTAATVQRRDIDHGTVSALFYINLAMGVVVMLAAMAAAPLAAWFFGDERVTWVVIAMALQIPFAAAAAQHNALLQRGMRWVAIHWTGITAQLAGAVVGIGLAWQTDVGYWSLVAQGWVTIVLGLVLVWLVSHWRPGRVTNWAGARSALKFGLNLTGFNLLNYFNRQADDVLIGWRWGATELGYYSRAYQLLMMPLQLINGPVGTAVIPALSRLQGDPERWRKAYLEALGAVVLVSSGITAILIATAEPLVALLFGPGWDEAATIFALLAISMFAATPMHTVGWVYISLGRTDTMLKWSLIAVPTILLAFLIGLPFGAQGLALAYSCAICALMIPGLALAAHISPVSTLQLFRIIALPTIFGVISALAGIVLLDDRGQESPLTHLVVASAVPAVLYVTGALAIVLLDPAFAGLKGWTPRQYKDKN
jgi:polysaccharide transporter, PST family